MEKIVEILTKNNFYLAPSEQNITPFRIICKEFGADIIFSKVLKTKKDIDFVKEDASIIATIDSPKLIASLEKEEKVIAIGIDAEKTGDGEIKEIIKKSNKPIIIIANQNYDFLQLNSAKISGIYIKFENDNLEGDLDYKLLKKMKESIQLPIIVGCRINNPEEIHNILKKTEADGVAFKEIALKQPVIFEQTVNYFEKGYYNKITKKRREKTVIAFEKAWKNFGANYDISIKNKLINKFTEE